MFLVGLTGGIATGKSTVGNIIREHGIPIIDADIAARIVVEPGKPAWHKIRKEFGDEVFTDDKQLDRTKLGEIIFNNVEKRRILNSITHTDIYKEMCWQAFKYCLRGYPFVVMDLPLLFETGNMTNYMHKIIVVVCDEEIQLERLMKRSGYSETKAKLRIAAQMPQEQKMEQANFLIENSGSLEDLRNQTIRVINVLQSSNYHWKLRFMIASFFLILLIGIYFLKILFFNRSKE
ncbi:hypothetical protein PV327_004779 [Microctonus hyperodae]|uniref:Dephospho-CoA kinase domain-containing protein n=1 Tax=Microctonus hyperodae TaxID=165561 RepID=A0AA39FD64_MICHY|nr:hypothetical protein PV327_004779 [Microctonus hyperodae]